MKKGTVALSGVVLAMIIACGLAGGYFYAEHQREAFKTHFGFLPSNTFWMNERASDSIFEADQKMISKGLEKEWETVWEAQKKMEAATNEQSYEDAREDYLVKLKWCQEALDIARSFGYESR